MSKYRWIPYNVYCSASKFEAIHDQFIDFVGLSDEFKRILELKKDLAILQLEYAITSDPTHLTFIQLKESEIRQQQTVGKSDFQNDITMVEKYRNIEIDERKMSVKKFYGYVKMMQKEADQIRAKQNSELIHGSR